ncbi:MAG: GntR family transcriptional regulator [Hyphomonadaceae bacterium]|nr:GntR family transcriptional regulator [Hyphomonadaceae bacterium]
MPKRVVSKRARSQPAPARPADTTNMLGGQNRSPLYHQIYLILRSRILDGEYGPGDYLPGERDLEALFQVSRITAVRALNELAGEGLVVRERGRGTRVQFVARGIVARGPVEPGFPGGGLRDGGEKVSSQIWADVTVHEFNYLKANRTVAEALKLAEGDLVQYAARSWRFESRPFNFVLTYVPEDIGRLWSKKEMETYPLGTLFEKHGVRINLVQEQVTATLADMLLSQRLEVSAGSPILKIKRIAFDAAGRPIEFVTGFYPPDRYQYEVTLPRKGGHVRGRPETL